MKTYVITGSIGHISRPIIEELVRAGKDVRVVTSSVGRATEIEDIGATALVGNVRDTAFLKTAFKNVDVVYTMIPPIWQTTNWIKSMNEVAESYAQALQDNDVKYVVNLSSVGADVSKGVGPVDGVHYFEKLLNTIPGQNIRHLRPAYFYSNLLTQIGMIKQAGIMGANFGEGEKLFLTHTNDIATVALEELLNLKFSENSVRYIISDERSGKEIAQAIGNAIGITIPWIVFTDDQQKQGLIQAGLSETHAENFTTLGRAIREGYMQADVRKNKPQFSNTKLEDFAKEFATIFNAEVAVAE
jgi:uncharacterized protein YbjT (DUF2867 family)